MISLNNDYQLNYHNDIVSCRITQLHYNVMYQKTNKEFVFICFLLVICRSSATTQPAADAKNTKSVDYFADDVDL